MRTVLRIWGLVRPYWERLAIAYVSLLAGMALALTIPWVLRQAIDVGVGVQPASRVNAGRGNRPITPLPDAQDVGRETGSAGDHLDGVSRLGIADLLLAHDSGIIPYFVQDLNATRGPEV